MTQQTPEARHAARQSQNKLERDKDKIRQEPVKEIKAESLLKSTVIRVFSAQ